MGITNGMSIRSVLSRKVEDFSGAEIESFWYDWFCKDTSLVNKGRTLLRKLRQIAPSPYIDLDKTYVFFKNNCPVNGSLYDDFRICDKKSDDVIYCVVPAEGYARTKGRSVVWGRNPLTGEWGNIVIGAWKDVVEFFHANTARHLEIIKECAVVAMIEEAEYEDIQRTREIAAARREREWKEWEANRKQRSEDQDHCDRLDYMLNR